MQYQNLEVDGIICTNCRAIATFGVVQASNSSFFGGYVDARGLRHDPLVHTDDCQKPKYQLKMPLLWEGAD